MIILQFRTALFPESVNDEQNICKQIEIPYLRMALLSIPLVCKMYEVKTHRIKNGQNAALCTRASNFTYYRPRLWRPIFGAFAKQLLHIDHKFENPFQSKTKVTSSCHYLPNFSDFGQKTQFWTVMLALLSFCQKQKYNLVLYVPTCFCICN